MYDPNILIKNLKFMRKRLGMTQETFSQAVGVTRPALGAYEEGRAQPRLESMLMISEVTGVSINDLLTVELTDDYFQN